jgi:hypothetical protein
MSGKHTPEPWTYEVHELSEGMSAIVYDAKGKALADHLSEDEARLIAAAPELLAALKRIGVEGNGSHWGRIARDAIAKATGET